MNNISSNKISNIDRPEKENHLSALQKKVEADLSATQNMLLNNCVRRELSTYYNAQELVTICFIIKP